MTVTRHEGGECRKGPYHAPPCDPQDPQVNPLEYCLATAHNEPMTPGPDIITADMEAMAVFYMLRDYRFHVDRVDIKQSPDDPCRISVQMDGHYDENARSFDYD